jgi:hypothetical protein
MAITFSPFTSSQSAATCGALTYTAVSGLSPTPGATLDTAVFSVSFVSYTISVSTIDRVTYTDNSQYVIRITGTQGPNSAYIDLLVTFRQSCTGALPIAGPSQSLTYTVNASPIVVPILGFTSSIEGCETTI